MTSLPNPFIDTEQRFVLDELRFMRDLHSPKFLSDPSPDFEDLLRDLWASAHAPKN